jgi:hypothetical protein
MAIIFKRGAVPNEAGALVRGFDGTTYSRMDALVAVLSSFPPTTGLVIQPHAVVSGPDPATGRGPDSLELVEEGHYRVPLVAGANVSDIEALLRAALSDGTILDHWIVEIPASGDRIDITDPEAHEPETAGPGLVPLDAPLRDKHLVRPRRDAARRTKVKTPKGK